MGVVNDALKGGNIKAKLARRGPQSHPPKIKKVVKTVTQDMDVFKFRPYSLS